MGWAAVAVGFLIGLYAAAFSFAVYVDVANPQMALKLHSSLPKSAARAGDLRLFEAEQRALEREGETPPGAIPPSLTSGIGLELPEADQVAVRRYAITALRSTSLSSPSLRQLAFFEKDLAQQRRLLNLANQVTRRDVIATLHRAELRLRENDIDGGLGDLDQSLVVSRTIDTAVFPLLIGAVGANKELADAVSERLSRDPLWSERLMRWAIANPSYLPPLTKVLSSLPSDSPARAPGFGQQVVDLLAAQHSYSETFAAYRAFARKDPDRSEITGGNYPPIDWKLVDSFDTGSRPLGDEGLEVFANPGRRGEFAQILTDFPAGAKRLRLRVDETMGGGSALSFTAVCLSGKAERTITDLQLPLRNGVRAFPFVVPPSDCPYQRLTLGITGDTEAASALIRSASFGSDNVQ